MEVYPGDKIVIHKAVLWLGAAAVFYLPLLVIPLRSVENQRGRAHWFPEVGYDSYEGAWIKIQIPFGKDQYYYGYYIVNYLHEAGARTRLRRLLLEQERPPQRQRQLYTINDQLQGGRRRTLACTSRKISRSICAATFSSRISPTTDRW